MLEFYCTAEKKNLSVNLDIDETLPNELYGDELMNIGLVFEMWGDYTSKIWRLKRI